jgi:hypothetical protein
MQTNQNLFIRRIMLKINAAMLYAQHYYLLNVGFAMGKDTRSSFA